MPNRRGLLAVLILWLSIAGIVALVMLLHKLFGPDVVLVIGFMPLAAVISYAAYRIFRSAP